MAEQFLGEIKAVGFGFPPKGWALCNGQLLPINQNQALFALLGTMYGGNGQTTFALPNLQGRVPMHGGQGLTQGQAGGEAAHALSASELPAHIHPLNATSGAATTVIPTNNLLAAPAAPLYGSGGPAAVAAPTALGSAGGSQPHNNMPPYLTLNFIIALQGIFPSRN
ncbi:phage tail protein [Deinococcus altitudinis]|uniref:phage tail protein n=1 Tax=Deinococcus altitudinis TaxID=468914 RepID=UPI0038919256